MGVGLGTASLGPYHMLNLLLTPDEDNIVDRSERCVMIYGGSTATGTISIQLARL